MKRIIACPMLLFTLTFPFTTFAADKNITVEWAMPSDQTSAIQKYVLKYSQNSGMQGAEPQVCEPFQQTGSTAGQTNFSMACSSVPIVTGQPAYFTLTAEDTEGLTFTSDIFSVDTGLSRVLDFQLMNSSSASPPQEVGGNSPPIATISMTTNSGVAPLTVDFDGSKSTDPDGAISTYSWNFGDGTTFTGISPSHEYSTAGTFPVTLTVTDDHGEKHVDSTSIIVVEAHSGVEKIVGNQDKYTSSRHIMHNSIVAYKLPTPPNYQGTLESISFSLVHANKSVKFALYTHDEENDLPNEIVPGAYTVEGVTTSDSGLLTLEIVNEPKPQVFAGEQYWLILQSTDDWAAFGASWDENARIVYKDNNSYDFAPWGNTATEIKNYNIGACYFTYTPQE